jgi:hypothetical protein
MKARLFSFMTAALMAVAPAGLAATASGSVDAPRASASTSAASCEVAAFDTSQSRFRPGLDNQGTVWGNSIEPPSGYWEDSAAYAVGFEWEAPYELRNHFTFDLSSLTAGSVTDEAHHRVDGHGTGGPDPAERHGAGCGQRGGRRILLGGRPADQPGCWLLLHPVA